MTRKSDARVPGSFRDPSGFLFKRDGRLYRRINTPYKDSYNRLKESGLYDELVENNLLIPHEETDTDAPADENFFCLIKPEIIPFISYPYEWCFSQLKDAALLTLDIQKRALERGMSLKDCSAYNVQFRKGKPVFIDTLSFEKYRENEPWVAYRQFCQHFLAPLALMSYKDIRLGQLMKIYIDGIPLDLASSLLPYRTKFSFSLFSHIHLHAKFQKRYEDATDDRPSKKISLFSLKGIIDSLDTITKKLKWKPADTEWGEYYDKTNYSDDAIEIKDKILSGYLDRLEPETVWDLGANTGRFSRIASAKGILTISFDIDEAAVEKNYLQCREKGEENILPLLLDLRNPAGGIGWANEERESFTERGPAGAVLALALIHHLAISNNVPFDRISDFFGRLSKSLIIEFIPKSDSQVRKLLATREDVFPRYTRKDFERIFGENWKIEDKTPVKGSERTLYLLGKQ